MDGIAISIVSVDEVPVPKVDWKDTEATVTKVTTFSARGRASYTVEFTYKVDDRLYQRGVNTFDAYRQGDSMVLRYNPLDPERNDLEERERRKKRIGISIAFIFFAMGGVILLFMIWFKLFGAPK